LLFIGILVKVAEDSS